MELKVGQIWKHYKGKHYKMVIFAKHSETGEELVVYQRQEDGNVYARPVDLFFNDVEWEGKTVSRFTFVSDN
jgi:hypothetical protein